jgi:hypothetical protein
VTDVVEDVSPPVLELKSKPSKKEARSKQQAELDVGIDINCVSGILHRVHVGNVDVSGIHFDEGIMHFENVSNISHIPTE